MAYLSPELADALIMNKARPRGVVANPSPIVAEEAAKQAQVINQVRTAGQGINLRNKDLSLRENALNQNQSQFDQRLAMDKDTMQRERRYGNLAKGLSAIGLGVGIARRYSDRIRQKEMETWQRNLDQKYGAASSNIKGFYDRIRTRIQALEGPDAS